VGREPTPREEHKAATLELGLRRARHRARIQQTVNEIERDPDYGLFFARERAERGNCQSSRVALRRLGLERRPTAPPASPPRRAARITSVARSRRFRERRPAVRSGARAHTRTSRGAPSSDDGPEEPEPPLRPLDRWPRRRLPRSRGRR
jgi:hypothetical protein